MPTFVSPTVGAEQSSGGSSGGGGATVSVYDMQLNQMENILSKDGFLSPADYAQLAEVARGFAGRLGTASKRASMMSKALAYERQANDVWLKGMDVSALNTTSEDVYRETQLSKYNDINGFLDDMINHYLLKVDAIDGRLNNIDPQDSVSFANYAQAYNEASDKLQSWQSAKQSYTKGEHKKTMAAYATADPDTGEITSIEYVPVGKNTIKGAKITNLTVEGMPLYLVPNRNENGVSSARFQNIELFSPNLYDVPTIDAQSGLVVQPAPLKTRDGYGTDFKAKELRARLYIPVGGYGIGMDGKTLYQNVDGTRYKKFTGFTPDMLGVNSNSLTKLPRAWESRLTPLIIENVDSRNVSRPPGFIGPIQPGAATSSPQSMRTPTFDINRLLGGGVNFGGGFQLPKAFQQPGGQELAQQKQQQITGGGLFNKIVQFGKNLFKHA